MMISAVLSEILSTGRTLLPDGSYVRTTSSIDLKSGELLQKAVLEVRPNIALEVGLAYGISTLFILGALAEAKGTKLIGIDPQQYGEVWQGGGIYNIQRAGYGHLYDFHEGLSQHVLPELASRGVRIQFGFIDGWHTFDAALIDFFYIDHMLEVGGIVVFDDVGYPAIRRVCEFVLANRGYEWYGEVRHDRPFDQWRAAKRLARKWLLPIYRTDRTPSAKTSEAQIRLDDVYFLALRKIADDSRRFDHFVAF